VSNPESRLPVTLDAIRASLAAGDFDALVGVAEGGSVEFKGAPYDLNLAAEKFELAKDLAAIGSSGIAASIVLPILTERRNDSPFEHATRVRPAPRDILDLGRYRQVAGDRVFPSLSGLEFLLHESPTDPNRVLLEIHVPLQRPEDQPFLVTAPIGTGGETLQGWLVGIPTRALDQTEHLRRDELHAMLVRSRSISPRLDEILTAIGGLTPSEFGSATPQPGPEPPPAVSLDAEQPVENPITDTLDAESTLGAGRSWRSLSTLQLMAQPSNRVTVPSFYAANGAARSILEHPPVTREDGWNLVTLDTAKLVAGGTRLRVQSGSRKLVELSESGRFAALGNFQSLLTVSANGVAAFGEQPGDRPLKINSLALVEFVHDFLLTYAKISETFEPEATTGARIGVGIQLTEDDRRRIFLPPGGVETFGWIIADDVDFPDRATFWYVVDRTFSMSEISEIALDLLTRIYAFFGRTVEQIPYLTDDRTAVDPTTFARVRG
jgi:hypothetical protein